LNAPHPAAVRRFAALAAIALVGLGIAACGGDDDTSTAADTAATSTEDTSTTAKGATVDFEADPSGALQYTETDVTAKAGNDTIEFDNPSSTGHDVVIEDESGNQVAETDIITDSTTSTTADLKPGTYTFYCSVPGHREAGMEGTLTVK
jgi:plastocyanin